MALFRWFKKKEEKNVSACTCCCEEEQDQQETPCEQAYGENVTNLGLRMGQAPCPCSIRKDGRNNWEYKKESNYAVILNRLTNYWR